MFKTYCKHCNLNLLSHKLSTGTPVSSLDEIDKVIKITKVFSYYTMWMYLIEFIFLVQKGIFVDVFYYRL